MLTRHGRRRTCRTLGALIEAKIEGHEVTAAPAEPQREVINLMEALRRSVALANGAASKKDHRQADGIANTFVAVRNRSSSQL